MPKSEVPRKRNPRTDRQTRNTGLGTYKKLLEATGNGFLVRPASGFLSQAMGIDSKGNVGFPIDNVLKDRKDRKSVGLVDEVLSLPTLVELLGFDPPQFSKDAASRLEELKQAIYQDMDISEPQGFVENAEDSLGVMLGQLPIPGKKKADLAVGAAKGTKNALKKILHSAPEFFSPTVDPKLSNYASGAGFGGALGALADSPEEEELPEEEVPRMGRGGFFNNAIVDASDGLRNSVGARPLDNPPATPRFPGQTLGPLPNFAVLSPPRVKRRRIALQRTLEDLLRYGERGEDRYFEPDVDPLDGTTAIPTSNPFDTPRIPPLSFDRNRGGFNQGGPVEMDDDQVEAMASALTNLVAKYRDPKGGMR